MLDRILRAAIAHRGLVVLATVALAGVGAWSLVHLPIDAVPDITNRQVQVNTVVPSLSPVEVEQQVTYPIETALAGIPGLDHTRSLSRNGFSQITAVFHDHVDVYFARQQVGERLVDARDTLPPGADPRLGPISTGLGEIFMWAVEFEHPGGDGAELDGTSGWQRDGSYLTPEGERLRTEVEQAAYLRTVQDWVIRPQLKAVEGVAAVDSLGGHVKQYQVQPDPRKLVAYGFTFTDLLEALERNNLSTGGGYIETNGESRIVRATGRIERPEAIEAVVVGERRGIPIALRDLATVGVGPELRTGSASTDGREVVIGTTLMLVGANSRTVARAVEARLAEINRTLPPDVRARPLLDRTHLVDATIATVERNLTEGAILVIVVLFVLLGNLRAAFITALAIPLSMLLTAIGMAATRTSGNLMSLGAIDFGLIVDGAVIIMENCLRHLAARQRELGRTLTVRERVAVVTHATAEVRGATAFGEAIIITVYVPILFLTGIEGKMFRPMALTVIFALVAAFVLSLTFVPAMAALGLGGRVAEHESAVVRWARRVYEPLLRAALRWRIGVAAAAVAVFVAALAGFMGLGREFVPTLNELDIAVHAIRIPSTGIEQSTRMQLDVERAAATVPEVAYAFSKTGTADIAGDPMPPNFADTLLMLKPRDQWPDPADTKEAVRRRVEAALDGLLGNQWEFTQPIEMRFNELIAGVRSDVAVKVYGDDFEELLRVANAIARVLDGIPGTADLRVEQVTGVPVLSVDVDRQAIARYGLTVADVQDVVSIAIGGRAAGQLFQGDRRFDIVVRLPEHFRLDPAALAALPVPLRHDAAHDVRPATAADAAGSSFAFLPLGALARIGVTEGPSQVSRENGKRRVVVQANVRGTDLGSYVEDARARVAERVALPPGTWLDWGGQFENLVAATRRLAVVVPICFLLILLLLYGTFGSVRDALIVFTCVPLALPGGVLALWVRDLPLSMSAAVGFIALSGVAVLNGLVLVTFINELRRGGAPIDDAVTRGALTRLRPVLTTALVASLGFVPMAIATGTGAEVQRPLATVVIGGLATSTVLTLFVLPAVYRLAARGRPVVTPSS